MRIALGIEYEGSQFIGWQRQNQVGSVQGYLELALSKIADEPITVSCAGRTDAGVHATAQVAHFDTLVQRPDSAWTLGVNTNLPDTVAVSWVKTVADEFHARFSATARRYRYIIYNHRARPAILGKGVTHVYKPLDEKRMHIAAQHLVGKQDFTSFRAVHCQAKSPVRTISSIKVSRQGRYIVIDVQANAFLHHMVRNITGSLIEVGAGEQSPDWIEWLLQQKQRKLAAATAKPNGLYLVGVTYPERFALPTHPTGPLFLADD